MKYRISIGQIRFHIEPLDKKVFFLQLVGKEESVRASVGFFNIIFDSLDFFESVHKDRFKLNQVEPPFTCFQTTCNS